MLPCCAAVFAATLAAPFASHVTFTQKVHALLSNRSFATGQTHRRGITHMCVHTNPVAARAGWSHRCTQQRRKAAPAPAVQALGTHTCNPPFTCCSAACDSTPPQSAVPRRRCHSQSCSCHMGPAAQALHDPHTSHQQHLRVPIHTALVFNAAITLCDDILERRATRNHWQHVLNVLCACHSLPGEGRGTPGGGVGRGGVGEPVGERRERSVV